MEQIPTYATASRAETAVKTIHEQKQKIANGFLNNAGILVGVFICFVVVLATTTEVSFNSFESLASLGTNFFLLLFCSYAMYISCSDSGKRAGMRSNIYIEAMKRHERLKRSVVESNKLGRLLEFCVYYVREELRGARIAVLAFAGISYETYEEKWLAADTKSVKESTDISEIQKTAIIEANKIRPIRLSPEMFMPRGKGKTNRAPIGTAPNAKKGFGFALKLLSTVGSVALTLIDFNPSEQSIWVFLASCCTNIAVVVINGFSGYRFGYENIVSDTVSYISDQSDMIEQAIQYIEGHPYEQNQNKLIDEEGT